MSVQMSTQTKNPRITALDALRILACFLVILNHSSTGLLLVVTPGSRAWLLYLLLFFSTKVMIPTFLMISGYTLLGKQDTWKQTRNRILRILSALLVFSLIYYIEDLVLGLKPFTLTGFLSMVWHGEVTDAFWYLYMYLGILLCLPLLQKLASAMSRQDFHILFFLAAVILGLLPILTHYLPGLAFAKDFSLPLLGGNILYLFVGYYLKTFGIPKAPIPAALGVLAGLLCNVLLTALSYFQHPEQSYWFLDNYSALPLAVESISLFILFFQIPFREKAQKLLSRIALNTFGIYLLTDFFVSRLHFLYYYGSIHMNRFLAAGLQALAVFLVGNVVVWLLRKIPKLNKLL